MKDLSIGIDFGTYKTLVSHINPQTGHPETLRLGRGNDYLPTTIFVDKDGQISFADDADDLLDSVEGCYLRGFKMHLGSPTPLHLYLERGQPRILTAKELVKGYLRFIRTQVEELVYHGQPITSATITRPVKFSPAQCEELRQAAQEAGFLTVNFTTEPEAAGLAFCRLNAAQAFKHSALIVDWGGGTLDFALVTRLNNSINTHNNLTDGETMGGENFDQKLWDHVKQNLESHGISKLNHITQLPRVRRAKEQLSSRDQVPLRLSYEGGTCPPLPLTRTNFNNLIAEDINRAAEKVKGLLARIPAEHKPEMLLLVGGSSKIPLIKEKLEAICELPAYSWHYSREAVAMGAALWGSTPPIETKELYSVELTHAGPSPFSVVRALPGLIPDIDMEKAMEMVEKTPCTLKKTDSREEAEKLCNELCRIGAEARLIAAGSAQEEEIPSPAKEPSTAPIHSGHDAIPGTEARSGANVHIGREEVSDISGAQLLEAIRTEKILCVQHLLEQGANPNQLTPAGTPMLHEALVHRSEKCVQLLLAAGAHTNTLLDETAYYPAGTPLHTAVLTNFPEGVGLLLREGADKNFPTQLCEDTPLALAVRYGYYDCAKLLLQNGANPNQQNFIGNTALHEAIWEYSQEKHESLSECVQLLLKNAADVNAENEDGDTPLITAVRKGAYGLIRPLLLAGASPIIRNHQNKAPFHYCPALSTLSEYETHQLLDDIVTIAESELLSLINFLQQRKELRLKNDGDSAETLRVYIDSITDEMKDTLSSITKKITDLLQKNGNPPELKSVIDRNLSYKSINKFLADFRKISSDSKEKLSSGTAGAIIGGIAGAALVAVGLGSGGSSIVHGSAQMGKYIHKKFTNSSKVKQINNELDNQLNSAIFNLHNSMLQCFYSLPLLVLTEASDKKAE